MRPQLSLILQTVAGGDLTRGPWVQGKWFIHYTMPALQTLELSFCGCSLAVPSAELGSFMVLWFLCLGASEGSTGSGSGFKLLRRWGHSLKSHQTDWRSWGSNWGPYVQAGLKLRVCNENLIFLFLNQNICCGCSKEPPQWDGSFEHPKHTLKLIGKKIFTISCWFFLFI